MGQQWLPPYYEPFCDPDIFRQFIMAFGQHGPTLLSMFEGMGNIVKGDIITGMMERLITAMNVLTGTLSSQWKLFDNFQYVLFRVLGDYLDKCARNLFPRSYSVSFSTSVDSAAMWGYYAASHSGVCLSFRTHTIDGKPHFKLKTSDGDCEYMPLHRVEYRDMVEPLNFFETIAIQEGKRDAWLRDRDGTPSRILQEMEKDGAAADSIRIRATTTKLAVWSHEGEYRLLRNGPAGGLRKNERIKRYDPTDLEAVIMGRNISRHHMQAVFDAVFSLPDNHAERIKFKWADYSVAEKKMKVIDMPHGLEAIYRRKKRS